MPEVANQAPHHAVTRRVLLGAWLPAGALHILPGCRSPPLPTYQEAPGDGVRTYLIAAGWHTEIALPITAIQDPLRAVTPVFQAASTSHSVGVNATTTWRARPRRAMP